MKLLPLMVPLLIALAIVGAATSAHRRLPPPVAARFVTVALVLAVVATLPTTVLIAAAFLTHVPVIGVGFEWCAQAIGLHESVPAGIGVPAVALLLFGGWRSVRLLRAHRSLRCHHGHGVQLVESTTPYAVTLPGAAGRIVVSSGLWASLDERERHVVLAHEQAHARYRHDRYLLAGELAAAVLPPLRRLSRRLAFTIERWADEVAARRCGDRELVAVTLGKVALHGEARLVPGFAGLGVPGRMAALMSPPRPRPPRAQVLALWSSLGVATVATAVQLHHLEALVMALCPH
jgi:hypothetical protein